MDAGLHTVWPLDDNPFLISCPWYILRQSPAIHEIRQFAAWAKQGGLRMTDLSETLRMCVLQYITGTDRGQHDRLEDDRKARGRG